MKYIIFFLLFVVGNTDLSLCKAWKLLYIAAQGNIYKYGERQTETQKEREN